METVYEDEGDYEKALSYNKLQKSIIELHRTPSFTKTKNFDTVGIYIRFFNGLASLYEKLNQLDSALKYIQIVAE